MADDGAPNGLTDRLAAVWSSARRELAEAETLTPSTQALLDEFVLALRGAEEARYVGISIAEDKAAKRASQLADQLGLSPKTRRGSGSERSDDHPFSALDELSERRTAKKAS